jgi:3-methyladenine DNA glycosylase/8-oxoguanine DNA glycosylase
VILGQRVTSIEAHRSWRRLCLKLGERAPGPVQLFLPPEPSVLASQPYWWFHPLGVDKQRADALRNAARHAARLFALDDSSPDEAARSLVSIPGIGVWTIGATLGHALGDTDAVAVGDYHLKNFVAYALAGEPRATDDRMLELLAPYAGQRGRVIALLATNGLAAPKYGPRQRILPMERW